MLSKLVSRATCVTMLAFLCFTAKSQLTTNFSALPADGCVPLVVNFTDQSTGLPNQWRWDLGNGTISYLKNPSVTYLTPGKYTITLVVRNAANNADSVTKTDFINVYAKPTVQFSAAITSGCYPLDVKFTDESIAGTDSVASWNWDFGDGFSSQEKNPLHTYTEGGNFNVTLQITNNNGCKSTLSKTAYIQISSGAIADFTMNNHSSCGAPAAIDFQNLSIGTGALEYEWSFGDGTTSNQTSPSHTYNTRGTYDVQLIVKNSSGCTDTILKKNAITVGTVVPNFTSKDSVCANSTLTFTNTSSPAPGSVIWDFGDGTNSTEINPGKQYNTAGNYIVKMIASFGACSDSTTKIIHVLANPVAAFTADDTADCKIPFKVNFINQSSDAVSYNWKFGNGYTSIAANPSNTFNAFGKFTVSLTASSKEGCVSSVTKTAYIIVQRPAIILKNLPDSGCLPFVKAFSDSVISNDPVTGRLWSFGDGNTSSTATPSYTYNTAGVYNVMLTVTTASGCVDSAKLANAIVVTTKPVVKFSANLRNTCAKNEIQFTDETTGGATKWYWRFGDGNTSVLQNPKHKYQDTGYYNIQLIVWNRGCPDSVTYTKYIHIDPPIAKFKTTMNCKKPFERVFTDQSIGADEWLWDFGDGTTSTQRSPVHVYPATGSYLVSLTVKNNTTGCDYTATTPLDVVYVKSSFFADDTLVCRGSQVNFTTGLSKSAIKFFNWNFGDGSPNINLQDNAVSYTYTKNGSFTVRLVITDILGCTDALYKNAYIGVGGPVAKFAPAVSGSCLNTSVQFTDSSTTDGTHPITNWAWEYGDGIAETLTTAPFNHSYANAGNYTVKLRVTDNTGCSDSTIIATPLEISQPSADFVTTDTITCPNKSVNFTNHSSGPSLTYAWDFGDGNTSADENPSHAYSTNGVYTVKLTITDRYGCINSITKSNYIFITSAVAAFTVSDSFSTCPPLLVQFTNKSSNASGYSWDFGDNTSSTATNPSHFYVYPGNYIAKLTVTGPGGCTTEMQKAIAVQGPVGNFTYAPVNGCNPVTVKFTATSNSKVTYIWDFNDGNTITTSDSVVSHTYTNIGAYRPKIILINSGGCQVPIRGADTIFVSGVTAKFNFANKALCDSGIISFTDSSTSNDVVASYLWNFGDGSTASVKNPVHQFTTTGIYYPSLVVTTQQGCSDTFTTTNAIRIVASPKIGMITSGNGCAPLNATFNGNLIAPDTSALAWSWTFGNGNTSALQNPPAQTYTASGVYAVNVSVTNSTGCVTTVNNTIEAYIVPTVSAGTDITLCNGSSITLNATGADTYNWTPATGLNCTTCASPTASPVTGITYAVTGTTTNGCRATDSVLITVKQPFTLTYSSATNICKGTSKKLSASGGNTYEWTPSTGLDNPVSAEPNAKPDTTTNYRVVGTDELGCFKDTGYVLVTVHTTPTVEAGADQTISSGAAIDLIPIVSPDVTDVIWSPTDNGTRNIYPGITVRPKENTEYTVEVSNNRGCRAKDKVTVFVICNNGNVFIPNTFSPNNDGANDIFYPRGTGLFIVKSLKIFNRWGEMVFAKNDFNANDPSSGWDGTYKGAKLKDDAYVYIIDIICSNKSILTFKGNVALIQ